MKCTLFFDYVKSIYTALDNFMSEAFIIKLLAFNLCFLFCNGRFTLNLNEFAPKRSPSRR